MSNVSIFCFFMNTFNLELEINSKGVHELYLNLLNPKLCLSVKMLLLPLLNSTLSLVIIGQYNTQSQKAGSFH